MTLVEPNASYYTGSGYLRGRPDAQSITVISDLAQWYAGNSRYDVILTRNCIHHFQNISMTAGAIRQKMNEAGKWFAWREQFATDPWSLYEVLRTHPYSQPHGLYEYAYPPEHYVDAITFAGFALREVIPRDYANRSLIEWQPHAGSEKARKRTMEIERRLRTHPGASVRRYKVERFSNDYLRGMLGPRRYTSPSAFLFSRLELPLNAADQPIFLAP